MNDNGGIVMSRMRKKLGTDNRLRVYSSKEVELSDEEMEELEYKIKKEVEKFKRDEKCGGIDDLGNFTRLHDRGL